ncbi:MAG TPA: F0F1 ATP synthase subunit B [Thermomicrobiales bacterium]|nr:F0F1 ATP synthase subunit B [Thermomicrobiales bacterium]
MDALGISAANFVVQLIAFILFVIIFWKFALGPITGMLDARQATIRESLEEAERVRREMAAAEARNEEILLEARREAQQILANAREQADQNIARSREQAQRQADEIVAQAQNVIQAEVSQARLDLRREVADLAVEAASRIVRANLDRDAQARLIDELLAEADRGGTTSLN